MIDIKLIRRDPERFKRAARDKRIACDVDALCGLDDRRRSLQAELDRILDKVHQSGIHSLTAEEKRMLKRATKVEQERSRRL